MDDKQSARTNTVHAPSGENAQNASSEAEALVTVRLDPAIHRMDDFICSRSEQGGPAVFERLILRGERDPASDPGLAAGPLTMRNVFREVGK